MFWSTLAHLFTVLLELICIRQVSVHNKDLEILILRHQLNILIRKQKKPIKPNRAEKLVWCKNLIQAKTKRKPRGRGAIRRPKTRNKESELNTFERSKYERKIMEPALAIGKTRSFPSGPRASPKGVDFTRANSGGAGRGRLGVDVCPVSVFCKSGDIYLHDPQCWHRGAPNTSDRTRYLMQSQYAIDWAYRRFGWMNRVPVTEGVLRSMSDRTLWLLGRNRPLDTDSEK
jgi:hypothetical protein